jgi:hypothetical protein
MHNVVYAATMHDTVHATYENSAFVHRLHALDYDGLGEDGQPHRDDGELGVYR